MTRDASVLAADAYQCLLHLFAALALLRDPEVAAILKLHASGGHLVGLNLRVLVDLLSGEEGER